MDKTGKYRIQEPKKKKKKMGDVDNDVWIYIY